MKEIPSKSHRIPYKVLNKTLKKKSFEFFDLELLKEKNNTDAEIDKINIELKKIEIS